MEKNWLALAQQKNQMAKVMETNKRSEQFGLVLREEDAKLILEERVNALREQGRVEFGEGIVPKIILEFCDSNFITQENYTSTILRLQDIFYLYKNEMQDEITDDELLHFMKEQFDGVCFGSLDYLEETCLSIFSQAVRAGYRGYEATEGYGEYSQFDEVMRWDYDLYVAALQELFGR